jgi:hypothetical protein
MLDKLWCSPSDVLETGSFGEWEMKSDFALPL